MQARGQSDNNSSASQPYYDKELEVGVLEAARDLQIKESEQQ